jgi:hypothetical protein
MDKHDVVFDRAGWGNYPRWIEAMEEFNQNHPSKIGGGIIEKYNEIKRTILY